MKTLFQRGLAVWRSLGHDAPVAFSPLLGIVMVLYAVVASCAWYAARRGPVEQWLRDYGIQRSESVVILIWLGVILFYTVLWMRTGRAPWKLSSRTHLTIIGGMVLFSAFWLYGRRGSFSFWFPDRPAWGSEPRMASFYFFVGASVLARFVLPFSIVLLIFRRPLMEFGLRFRGAARGGWIYVGLVVIVALVVVFYASTLPVFLKKYPWCRQAIHRGADGQLFIQGQFFIMYTALSFIFYFSAEAFWRGFILFGAEKELGKNALFFMLMPYVLGHLGKPLQETLGAVLAGLVLGTLAYQHRSFIWGAIAHWLVALVMDLSALYRRGVDFVF